MKLKIKITKDVLEESKYCGTPQSKKAGTARNCAVAIAINQLFPYCAVIGPYFYIDPATCSKRRSINLPKEATDFVNKFDDLRNNPEARINLPELEFEIDIPTEIIESIDISEALEIIKTSKTLELI